MSSIKIVTTDSEFWLYIPPEQKERAKKVWPRHWSTKEKCWIYPKNREVYDALLNEFGRGVFLGLKTPHSSPASQPQNRAASSGASQQIPYADPRNESRFEQMEAKIQEKDIRINKLSKLLEERTAELATAGAKINESKRASSQQIGILQEKISLLQKNAQDSGGLIGILKEKDTKIDELISANSDLKVKFDDLARELEDNKKRVKRLQEMDKLKDGLADFDRRTTIDLLKSLADEGTGGSDVYFVRDVMSIEYNEMFCIELSKRLYFALQKITGENEDLFSLIKTAEELGILSDEAIDYAHTIRKQGNTIRHSSVDKRTYSLRNAYAFVAAALLWPLLPEY